MSYPERTAARLPHYLHPETMKTLEPDSPRFISPKDVYIDAEHYLFLSKGDRISVDARRLKTTYGQVAIMLTMISTGETGYVADLRMTPTAEQMKDIATEDLQFVSISTWDDDEEQGLPIIATISRDPECTLDEPTGDPDFFDAAWYLAGQVDLARIELGKGKSLNITPYKFTWKERYVYIPAIRIKEFLGIQN